jgi:hypothetical protein
VFPGSAGVPGDSGTALTVGQAKENPPAHTGYSVASPRIGVIPVGILAECWQIMGDQGRNRASSYTLPAAYLLSVRIVPVRTSTNTMTVCAWEAFTLYEGRG